MKRVHYGGTWQQARGYSPMVATEGGRILWLSGHVGVTEESGGWGFAPDFDAQVHQSFRNIEQTLARAGGRPAAGYRHNDGIHHRRWLQRPFRDTQSLFPERNLAALSSFLRASQNLA